MLHFAIMLTALNSIAFTRLDAILFVWFFFICCVNHNNIYIYIYRKGCRFSLGATILQQIVCGFLCCGGASITEHMPNMDWRPEAVDQAKKFRISAGQQRYLRTGESSGTHSDMVSPRLIIDHLVSKAQPEQ